MRVSPRSMAMVTPLGTEAVTSQAGMRSGDELGGELFAGVRVEAVEKVLELLEVNAGDAEELCAFAADFLVQAFEFEAAIGLLVVGDRGLGVGNGSNTQHGGVPRWVGEAL